MDPWEQLSFASDEDVRRATGSTAALEDTCRPADVMPSDFPNRYAFNAAWQNLDLWVRRGIAPPRAPALPLKPRAAGEPFDPERAFVEAKLRSLYPEHAAYVAKLKRSAAALQQARWLTPADAREIVAEAERARAP